jgi:hypothetical protein
MNCSAIEQWIPLFVEGDLDNQKTDLLEAHVISCEGCSQILVQFQESQASLKNYLPPSFDELSLGQMRKRVLVRIEESPRHVIRLRSLFDTRRWAPVLAAAALLLMAVSLGFYFYSGRGAAVPSDQIGSVPGELPAPDAAIDHPQRESSNVVIAKRLNIKKRRVTNPVKQGVEPPNPEEILESPIISQIEETATQSFSSEEWVEPFPDAEWDSRFSEWSAWSTSTGITNTKIEIQTSDPDVRIIWFAPRANSNSSTRTDADTHAE